MTAPVLQKYLSKPFVGSSHSWAMQKLADLTETSRVLDIGCGSGVLGRFLSELGIRELYAVEPEAEAREHAALIYRRAVSSIDELNGERFDAVLLLDVLEHLRDYTALLQQSCHLLNPGGLLLVSVPNIAHWSIRLSLLFGYFEYTSRGILDVTHVSFFTRRSFRRMLDSCREMQIESLESSIEPAEFVLPALIWDNQAFRFISRRRLALANFWPGLFAYQHLAVLRKDRQA